MNARSRRLTVGDRRILHFGTFFADQVLRRSQKLFRILSYIRRASYVPDWTHLCPRKKNVLTARPLSFPDKLRRNTMLTIPLTIVAASISAAVYMAFGWRPPEPKRVRHFFYEMQRQTGKHNGSRLEGRHPTTFNKPLDTHRVLIHWPVVVARGRGPPAPRANSRASLPFGLLARHCLNDGSERVRHSFQQQVSITSPRDWPARKVLQTPGASKGSTSCARRPWVLGALILVPATQTGLG